MKNVMKADPISIGLDGSIQYQRNGDRVGCTIQYIAEDLSDAIMITSDPRVCAGEDIVLRVFLPLENSPIKCTGRITRRSESDGLFEYSRGYLVQALIRHISQIDRRRFELLVAQRKAFINSEHNLRLPDTITPGLAAQASKQFDNSEDNARVPALVAETESLRENITRPGDLLGNETGEANKLDIYNILVVDDELANLNALERTLRPLKHTFKGEYNVFSATNGEDAWSIIEENDIAFVIADQRMPGMTGVELLEKALQKYPDTIRIILTAYTDERLLMDSINKVHVHGYIHKPWEPEEVISIVKQGFRAYGVDSGSHIRMMTQVLIGDEYES